MPSHACVFEPRHQVANLFPARWAASNLLGRIVTELIQKLANSVTVTLISSQEIDFSNPLLKQIQPNLLSVTTVASARFLAVPEAPSPASISDVVSVILAIGFT